MSNRRILLLLVGVVIATLCMLLSLHDARLENPVSSNVAGKLHTAHNGTAIAGRSAVGVSVRH